MQNAVEHYLFNVKDYPVSAKGFWAITPQAVIEPAVTSKTKADPTVSDTPGSNPPTTATYSLTFGASSTSVENENIRIEIEVPFALAGVGTRSLNHIERWGRSVLYISNREFKNKSDCNTGNFEI